MDLIKRTRADAGYNVSKPLPFVYSTNSEFLGSLLGLIDFMAHRFGESTPTNEVTRQVVEALFGENAATVFSPIRSGADNPVLMNALEKTQEHLEWTLSRSRSETEHLLFLDKFFQ